MCDAYPVHLILFHLITRITMARSKYSEAPSDHIF
jgi:hypothetical protein